MSIQPCSREVIQSSALLVIQLADWWHKAWCKQFCVATCIYTHPRVQMYVCNTVCTVWTPWARDLLIGVNSQLIAKADHDIRAESRAVSPGQSSQAFPQGAGDTEVGNCCSWWPEIVWKGVEQCSLVGGLEDGGDAWGGAYSSAIFRVKCKAGNSVWSACGTTGLCSRQNEQKYRSGILIAELIASSQHLWVQHGHMQSQKVSQVIVLHCISLLPWEVQKLLDGACMLRFHCKDGPGSDTALASGLTECHYTVPSEYWVLCKIMCWACNYKVIQPCTVMRSDWNGL